MALEMRKHPFEAELRKSSKLQSCGSGNQRCLPQPLWRHQNHKGLGKKALTCSVGIICSFRKGQTNAVAGIHWIALDEQISRELGIFPNLLS